VAIEHIRAGIESHAAHQQAMKDAALAVAAQRDAEAVASEATAGLFDVRAPVWPESTEESEPTHGDSSA